MPTKVLINGVLSDGADARVPVFDRGFLYGDSVFEVMRTYGGVPFAEHEHLERLRRSASRLLIEVPVPSETLHSEIGQALVAAGNEESYVRVMVTRGTGPLTYDPTTARDPLRVVIVTELPIQPRSLYEEGVEVVCLRASRPTEDPRAAGAKASNYLSNLLAVHEAKQRGGYEAILLDPQGLVLEGASSNVFVVKHGHVRTPRLDAGILAGITRATVIAAAGVERIRIEEAELFPSDLYDADEVFITSSIRELVPVVRVDGRPVGSGRPGPVARKLHAAFRRAVGV